MPQYCNQGHENPSGSRFCLQCGEKLNLPASQGIYPGQILGGRYRIVRQLGHGGFGRTYLTEDINRFNELCVLKEFAPQVQTTYILEKAEELFEREAGVLYKLQHPQIPRFRELFRVNLDGKGYIFLVQDYVDGQTYRALLDARKLEGLQFNEAEVTQMLLQLLPVLEYIHSLGVIHRDISPENLILRNSDWLPVLIDFGGVKQVAATVASQHSAVAPIPPTLLGKLGYAPEEQMRLGAAYPHSDLYALAATVLVLLTGKEPQELIDGNTLTWTWRQEIRLSPMLGSVLDRMLQPRQSDRYQSAHQVLLALTGNLPINSYSPPRPTPSTGATLAVAARADLAIPQPSQPRVYTPTSTSQVNRPSEPSGNNIWLFLLPLVGAVGMLFWAANSWIQSHPSDQTSSPPPTQPTDSTPTKTPEPKPTSPYSPQEEARRQALFNRGKELGIDENFLFGGKGLVNQLFHEQYPQQRPLTPGPEDADSRSQWYKIADGLLDTLEQLSPEARRQLGSYNAESRDQAKAEVNELHLSSRALYDLADAAFFHLFPQRDRNLNQPIGQVWQGIVADKVKAVQDGTALERIGFDPGATSQSVNGTLKPGEGKAYIANLSKDQLVEVKLQANQKTQLSIYPPTSQLPPLLKAEKTWAGKLERSGLYEFVVISTGSESSSYQLNLTADNPLPTPSPQQPSTSNPTTPSPSSQPDITTPLASPTSRVQ